MFIVDVNSWYYYILRKFKRENRYTFLDNISGILDKHIIDIQFGGHTDERKQEMITLAVDALSGIATLKETYKDIQRDVPEYIKKLEAFIVKYEDILIMLKKTTIKNVKMPAFMPSIQLFKQTFNATAEPSEEQLD